MKRYNFSMGFHNKWEFEMAEHPQGKYCLYEDVPQWVSVEERLPGKDLGYFLVNVREYICFDENGDEIDPPKTIDTVDTGEWKKDSINDVHYLSALGYIDHVHITHWMPLPNPPREE